MSLINPVAKEKAAPELKETFDNFIQKSGRVPNFFAVMAHCPPVLKNFVPLYSSIINQGTVEPKLKELAYLKTSQLNGCEYCTRAHTASSKRFGVTADQIQSLLFYRRSSLFDEREKAVILYAERVTRGAAALRDKALEELQKFFNEDQIVELTLTICVANFTNRFNDSLQIEPDLG